MSKLKVMLVKAAQGQEKSSALNFTCADCEIVATVSAADDLLSRIAELEPEVVIIDMDAPNRDTLENLRNVQSSNPRPMVMFSQDDDPASIRRAVQAGVSAYVVDGIQAKRVRPILHAAIARFEQYRKLNSELEQARSQLADRKIVDRAKGIIMAHRNLSEPEAYKLLRDSAMTQNLRIAEVAQNIISTAEILGSP